MNEKILVLTDIHSEPGCVYEYLDNNHVDYIMITGDITEFGPEDYFVETLNRMAGYAPVYALQGNCDPEDAPALIDKSRAVNIHDRTVKLEDITIVGFGGSNPTPFDTPNEFSEEIMYEHLSKFSDVLQSENYTILVTHAPPYNTKTDKIEAGAHVGSKSVRKIIEETQPTLNLCGHVHESKARDKIGKTITVNPANASDKNAAILTITPENIKNKNVEIELITL